MFDVFEVDAVRPTLAEIDAWRDRMDRRRPLLRRWAGRLRRDLEAEAIAASTRMEGVAVTVDDVRRILAGDPPREIPPGDVALVRGYHDAMTYVLRRADDQNFEWNRELIVGVHDRVLAGRYEDGAGRLRTGPSHVVELQTGRIIFEPPPADEVPLLVDQLCAQVAAMDVHPALLAAWFHVAFGAIHPFADGNGRTARVLSSLIMYRGGFRTRTFTSLEEWWGRHPQDYYAAFKCLGPRFDPSVEVTPFLVAHTDAQLRQIRALDLRERTIRGVFIVLENIVIDRHLPERLTTALWDSFFGFTVTAGSYRGVTDVSPATATADLRGATAAGLLAPVGQTRGRRYVAAPGLFHAIAAELDIPDLPPQPESARTRVITELGSRLLETVTPPVQPSLFDAAGLTGNAPEPGNAARTRSIG